MSEREKLLLETKKEIRSILLSTKTGVELTRLNKEYEMFTGAKINYRGMGYTSLRAFVDDIPDVARQFDDGYGTITLVGVADESTRHIASLVSRQRGKKKSMRGRHFPGPRLGILSNLSLPRSSYASRSFADSHSYAYGSRFSRTITRTNPGASPMAGKLRSSVSDQKSAAIARPIRQASRDVGRETVVPALLTMDPGMRTVVPGLKTMDPAMKPVFHGLKAMDPGMKTVVPGVKTMNPGMQAAVPGMKTVVPEPQMGVLRSKTFVPNLNTNIKEMLSVLVERLSGSVMYSSFKKSFEKEYGVKLDLAEFGFSSVSEMFSCLGIPVRVKPFCSDDYTILPGPVPAASDTDKGEIRQRHPTGLSIPVFSVEKPAAGAQNIVPHAVEGPRLPAPYPASQLPVHCLEGAPPVQCPSMPSRPSSRRMSLVSRCSRTAASVTDKPKMPSTPSVSQDLRNAISQVLKNSPDGILMGDLEKKLKEMTGIEIDIEATGARSLEHLLVNVPEIVLMQYRGHGQLLLFDPGQTAIKDNIDQRPNFERKDTPATDVDCSGRGLEHQGLGQMHESRSKPRDLPDDSVGPEQVIATQQLPVRANEYLPIYVSSVVTPGHFWFQIDGEQYGRLVDLMEMLQSTYNDPKRRYEMPPSLMKIGQLCAAKFPEDSNWHRGTIMGFKDSLVQIYYLDYGTTSFVTKDLLRILRSQYLSLPAQAIRARLANVQPTKGEWSEAAYTFFMEHFTNKRLMALITDVTRDGLVSVCLTDKNGENDVRLNDCLVMDGYAVLQVDDCEPEVPVPKKEDKSTSFPEPKSVKVKPSGAGDEEEAIQITEQDIKFVQLPPNYGCHMVRISDKLYIISNEISAFLWEENVLRTMVRQKGYGYLPKLVLRIEDHLAAMEELAKFNIPGVFVNGEFAEILVLYELSIVIQILEIFEHKSDELKSELKKHLDTFSANPSKWTASTVPCVGDEDCATIMSDDLALRSGPSRCNIEASNIEDAKEGKELQQEWKIIAEQRKKLLSQMRNSPSPKTSAFTVEELSRMEGQMKALEDRYDTIQKRLGITDATNVNAKINSSLVTASIADAMAEKIRGLAVAQKKPRTNAVAPMTQAEPAQATSGVQRDSTAPVSRPSAGHHPLSAGLPSGVGQQPPVSFAPTVRPGMEYGQQMEGLAQMLTQMTIRNPAPLSSPVNLLGLAGIGYQLPNPQLHNPFGYSAAQILMQQQQSYFAALQGLSSLVSNGASFPQTPYDSSLLGITNLSYLAHAAPSGSAMPRTNQQGPQQN